MIDSVVFFYLSEKKCIFNELISLSSLTYGNIHNMMYTLHMETSLILLQKKLRLLSTLTVVGFRRQRICQMIFFQVTVKFVKSMFDFTPIEYE